MSRTKKPCPGCGTVDRYRSSGGVCGDCSHAIKEWKRHAATVNAKPETIVVRIKGAYHWYPQFYFGENGNIPELNEVRDELGRLFAELGERLCAETVDWVDSGCEGESLFPIPDIRHPKQKGDRYPKPAHYPASRDQTSYDERRGFIDRRTAELLRALWDRTARFTELAYLGGVEYGKSLLLELASGDLSMADFEERESDIAAKVRNAQFIHCKLSRKRR